jgi:starch phosphorylase
MRQSACALIGTVPRRKALSYPGRAHPQIQKQGLCIVNTAATNFPGNPEHQVTLEDDRVALSKEALKHAFLDNLFYMLGKFPELATKTDYYLALAFTVRDRMLQRWISTAAAYTQAGSRTVAYLSAEFLVGPHLANNLVNLGVYDTARQAVTEFGLNFEELLAQEIEPGLGNGGLGRLAACFIDSMATLGVPSMGYGIRYEYGIFQQEIVDGAQVEKTDKWLRAGNPWEIIRPEWAVDVKLGGYTERYTDDRGPQPRALGAGARGRRRTL